MHKYEAILYRSKEDRVFVAEILELPGYMSQGDSNEDTFRSINEAVKHWGDTVQETGHTAQQPNGKRPLAWSNSTADEHRTLSARQTTQSKPLHF